MNVNNNLLDADGRTVARLGESHGYAFDGDLVRLNAVLEVADASRFAHRPWSLQLWATDAPYSGGALAGTKVAEVALGDRRLADQYAQIEDSAFARLPAGAGEHCMVMALACSDRANTPAAILDYANYPLPQRFDLPRFVGRYTLRVDAGRIDVAVEAIENPRSDDNLSGTLSLQVWALRAPYHGGDFEGVAVAGVELGQLAGGAQRTDICFSSEMPKLADGEWNLVVMVREWTSVGYITRDYRTFPQTHTVAPVVRLVVPAKKAVAEVVVPPVARPAVTPANKAAATQPAGVSVNRASEVDLAAVKGMPKAVAKAIVADRPYAKLDDLLRVKGMGAKLLEKLRGLLQI